MTPWEEESRLMRDETASRSQPADRPPKSTTPTQRDRVLAAVLKDWVCAVDFLHMHIPRYGARLYDLRREGIPLQRRLCADMFHDHESVQYEWRVDPDADLHLPGLGG